MCEQKVFRAFPSVFLLSPFTYIPSSYFAAVRSTWSLICPVLPKSAAWAVCSVKIWVHGCTACVIADEALELRGRRL